MNKESLDSKYSHSKKNVLVWEFQIYLTLAESNLIFIPFRINSSTGRHVLFNTHKNRRHALDRNIPSKICWNRWILDFLSSHTQ